MSQTNVQVALKVAEQITTRLFDHRQFTTGEINYFVNEFEFNHKLNENFDRTLKVNEDLITSAYLASNDLTKLSSDSTKSIEEHLSQCEEKALRLLQIENEHMIRDSKELTKPRERRANLKEEYIKIANEKINKASAKLKEDELELQQKYQQFEENLVKNLN